MIISLGRLENETAFAPSAYDCLVAGHGITGPLRRLSPTKNLREQEH
jgi:hypothetical protein